MSDRERKEKITELEQSILEAIAIDNLPAIEMLEAQIAMYKNTRERNRVKAV